MAPSWKTNGAQQIHKCSPRFYEVKLEQEEDARHGKSSSKLYQRVWWRTKAGSRDSGRGKAFCSAVCCVVHPALSFCSTPLSARYWLGDLLVLLFSFSLTLHRSVHPCSDNLALISFQAWTRLPKQKDSILLMRGSTANLSNIHFNVQLSLGATRDSVSIRN